MRREEKRAMRKKGGEGGLRGFGLRETSEQKVSEREKLSGLEADETGV